MCALRLLRLHISVFKGIRAETCVLRHAGVYVKGMGVVLCAVLW
jgi:hypothetical protein